VLRGTACRRQRLDGLLAHGRVVYDLPFGPRAFEFADEAAHELTSDRNGDPTRDESIENPADHRERTGYVATSRSCAPGEWTRNRSVPETFGIHAGAAFTSKTISSWKRPGSLRSSLMRDRTVTDCFTPPANGKPSPRNAGRKPPVARAPRTRSVRSAWLTQSEKGQFMYDLMDTIDMVLLLTEISSRDVNYRFRRPNRFDRRPA